MTILVTGGTGFVGAHLVRKLLGRGERVRVLARQSSPRNHLAGLTVEWADGDLTDAASLRAAVRGCEYVYHAAALYSFWEPRTKVFYDVNVTGTAELLSAAAESGVKRVVYTSTMATVGAAQWPTQLLNEDFGYNLWELRDDYMRAKWLAEQEALRWARRGLDVIVVNPSGPVGHGDIRPTPTGLMLIEYIKGSIPGYLAGGINLVDVESVAAGHLLAMEKGERGARYLLTDRNLTYREIFGLFARITGLAAPPLRIPYFAALLGAHFLEFWSNYASFRPPLLTTANIKSSEWYFFFSNDRAVRQLGWRPAPLEEAVKKAVNYFAHRGYLGARGLRRLKAAGFSLDD